MRHNKSDTKKQVHNTKYLLKKQLNITPESSTTKRRNLPRMK